MLSVEMLKAERGDSILIEYGEGSTPTNRVLIDGGPVNSGLYGGIRDRLLAIEPNADGNRHFDLLVISHIDADHIEGVIRLLQDTELGCVFDDVWFNGWKHIKDLDAVAAVATLGAAQGEFLGALLSAQDRPWNVSFDGAAVLVPDGDDAPPVITLAGGLELTLVSPTTKQLTKLATQWEKELADMGFQPGESNKAMATLGEKWWAQPETLGDGDPVKTSNDTSAANGSSIAFIARWRDRAVLLAADAYDDVLTESLRRVRAAAENPDARVHLDGFKLSHHGSENNISAQLMNEVTVDAYLVSSNGKRFGHPNPLAIKTVIDHHAGPEPAIVCFNYRQPKTESWEKNAALETRYEEDAHLIFD